MSALRQEGYSVPAAPGGCGEGPLWAAPTWGDAVITRGQGRKQAMSRLFSQIVASRFQRLTPGGGEPHAPVLDGPSPRLRFTRRKPCCRITEGVSGQEGTSFSVFLYLRVNSGHLSISVGLPSRGRSGRSALPEGHVLSSL